MRNQFAETFYELGKRDPTLAILVADISPAGSIAKFRTEFPERFINTGVAEQIMIGMSAGMSQRGMRPFAYTIATFALFRPFEFVRNDLCYQNLPVTLVGIGGGVSYSTLGGTHHAMEDVPIACAMPNMHVIAPCDPLEVVQATRWCAQQELGPVYLRLGKAGEANYTAHADEAWQFGKIRRVQRGSDCAILAYGPIFKQAALLADHLRDQGKSAALYSCHTLKPLDRERIESILEQYPQLIVIEETVPNGSLGMQIKQIAWEQHAKLRLDHFCLQDSFIHHYGTHDDLLRAHGLSLEQMLAGLSIASCK